MIKFIIMLLIPLQINLFPKQLTDDQLHYLAGLNITNVVGTATYLKTQKPGLSMLIGFLAGAAAGIGKEYIWDRAMGKGHFEIGDMTTTIWGSMIGTITVRIGIEELHLKRKRKAYNIYNSNLDSER